jgi:hypothetical protein
MLIEADKNETLPGNLQDSVVASASQGVCPNYPFQGEVGNSSFVDHKRLWTQGPVLSGLSAVVVVAGFVAAVDDSVDSGVVAVVAAVVVVPNLKKLLLAEQSLCCCGWVTSSAKHPSFGFHWGSESQMIFAETVANAVAIDL